MLGYNDKITVSVAIRVGQFITTARLEKKIIVV